MVLQLESDTPRRPPVIHSAISKTLTRGPVGVRGRAQNSRSVSEDRPLRRSGQDLTSGGRRTGQLSLHGGDAKPN